MQEFISGTVDFASEQDGTASLRSTTVNLMDQGIGISTHDLLAWIGAAAFYLVFTLMAIYQWHHPEHVPYKWFPFHEEPGDRTTPKRIRQVRFGTIVSLIGLNAMAVMWIVQQCTR